MLEIVDESSLNVASRFIVEFFVVVFCFALVLHLALFY